MFTRQDISQKYNVLMNRAFSKGVIARITADTDELPALLDDAYTPRLPGCTKLFWTMCVRAVALVAGTGRMALAEAYAECETLKSNMPGFSAPETHQITTIDVHED